MFDSKQLKILFNKHRQVFIDLSFIENNLNERFYGMKDPIHALILACASAEPLLLIGPPGTAKSYLIRALCDLLGIIDITDQENVQRGYFEYLLTPFTEPGELFGYFDISKLMRDSASKKLTRMDEGMMQKADVVYLDEVFNASSAILNSLLAFMNERFFHDRGERTKAEWKVLFAATNHLPESPELRAIFDRFVLRCWVSNISSRPEELKGLFEKGWVETYSRKQRDTTGDYKEDSSSRTHTFNRLKPNRKKFPKLLVKLKEMREELSIYVDQGALVPDNSSPFFNELSRMIDHVRNYNLSDMSNRRIIKMVYIMLIDRIYSAVNEKSNDPIVFDGKQLRLLPAYFLDSVDDYMAVDKLKHTINPWMNPEKT
jgi:MoxR-like ATPase